MTDDLQERAREVLAETIGVKPEALNYAFLIPHDDALRAMLAFASPTPEPSSDTLREAAQALIEGMSGTYTARNGRQLGIEAEDGEKCWIVHSDLISELEAALASLDAGSASS